MKTSTSLETYFVYKHYYSENQRTTHVFTRNNNMKISEAHMYSHVTIT